MLLLTAHILMLITHHSHASFPHVRPNGIIKKNSQYYI